MSATEITTIITAVLGSVGGWEAVKYLLNRKFNNRKEEAETDLIEFHALTEMNKGLQEQLKLKEDRFTDQTKRLREAQDEMFSLMKEKAQLELDLQKYKCIRRRCANREPQNGY